MTIPPPTPPPPTPAARPSFAALARAFLTIGGTSFGGGRAAYFQDELVTRRRWFSEAEFLEALAISQILPGPNVSNLASYLGQRLRGWRGSLVAVAMFVAPGTVVILALSWLYFRGMPTSISAPIGYGVSAAAVGVAGASLVRLRRGATGLSGYAIALLAFVLFGPLGWPIHFVLLACIPISYAVFRMRR